jgi:hypothetical protein
MCLAKYTLSTWLGGYKVCFLNCYPKGVFKATAQFSYIVKKLYKSAFKNLAFAENLLFKIYRKADYNKKLASKRKTQIC